MYVCTYIRALIRALSAALLTTNNKYEIIVHTESTVKQKQETNTQIFYF